MSDHPPTMPEPEAAVSRTLPTEAVASEPADPPSAPAIVPPLPPVRGAGLAHFVVLASVLWLIALIVLMTMIPTLRSHDAMLWLWTAACGFALSFVGLAIYFWQRAAARRGSKGASQMALEENLGRR